MPVDNALNCRQSDSRTGKIGGSMKPLESAEQLFGMRHVEARSIIPDEIDRMSVLICDGELNLCLWFPAGKLPRVAEQILKDRMKQMWIPMAHDVLLDYALDPALRLVPLTLGQNYVRHRAEIH